MDIHEYHNVHRLESKVARSVLSTCDKSIFELLDEFVGDSLSIARSGNVNEDSLDRSFLEGVDNDVGHIMSLGRAHGDGSSGQVVFTVVGKPGLSSISSDIGDKVHKSR